MSIHRDRALLIRYLRVMAQAAHGARTVAQRSFPRFAFDLSDMEADCLAMTAETLCTKIIDIVDGRVVERDWVNQ